MNALAVLINAVEYRQSKEVFNEGAGCSLYALEIT